MIAASLIALTTHTVLHNLIFGCLLVFLIQWIFLGDLRSAIIVGLNIPFALFFAIMLLVMQGESANLLSVGAVDFGIIVDSAVILVENIFRNFQAPRKNGKACWNGWPDGYWGPTRHASRESTEQLRAWTDRLRLILISAHAGGQGGSLLGAHHRGGVCAAVHHAGSRGPDFRPHGAHLWLRAGGSLDRHFHRHARAGLVLLPEHVKETETIVVRVLHRVYNPTLRFALAHRASWSASGWSFLAASAFLAHAAGQRVSARIWRRAIFGFAPRCR